MSTPGYEHPVTFSATGDLRRDFAHAFADYDCNVRPLLAGAMDQPILEIGCGWGQFLLWLRERGYNGAIGIDVGRRQVEFCRSLGLEAVVAADSTRFLLDHARGYQLIALHHVIEHMPSSAGLALLSAAHGSLRPGGRILVQTPNMSAASAGFSRYIEISHETGYAETSLAEILDLAGFESVHIFGSRTPLALRPKRVAWLAMRALTRALWRAILMAELGSDTPRILDKNIFGTGMKPPGRSS